MPAEFAPIAYVAAFIAVVLVAQTVSGLIFASRDRTQRVNRRLTMLDAGADPDAVYASLMRRAPAPKIDAPILLRAHEWAVSYLRQAGLRISPLQLLGVTAAIAGTLLLLRLAISHSQTGLSFLGNTALSMVGSIELSVMSVWLWVGRRRANRIKQLEQQLPVALDIINRAIRAGHPVISAVRLASEELSDPIGTEFGLIVDETSYGYDLKDALLNFARRTGSNDAHFFAVSISIQSETGGNLAEILAGLAGVIRGRHTLTQRVRALSSEGRTSAILISVLPVFMVAVQMMIHPGIYSDKFSDPIFWPIVVGTGIVYFFGWLIVRRIINFRY